MIDLHVYGWDDSLPSPLPARGDLAPARVVAQHRASYDVIASCGPLRAALTGRLRHEALLPTDLPAVGDWALVAPRAAEGSAALHALYPRRTALIRKAAGPLALGQVLAANVDVVLVTAGLDTEPNERRLERYVTAAWESGAQPVLVLTKSDLSPDLEGDLARSRSAAPGVELHLVCAPTGEGLPALAARLAPGLTAALVGPSGAGKSTLANALLGRDVQPTGPTRSSDGRGRHTTTGRQLLPLPGGGCLIDTPGLRELGLWDEAPGSLEQAFPEVEALALRCRFRDCGHDHEPDCAVLGALDEGALDPGRLASYRKLRRELAHVRRKADREARRTEQRRWKRIGKAARQRRRLEGW